MPSDLAVLAPDANVLLHYKSLREIDWQAVADAKTVKLVLCLPVIHEVDQKTYEPRLSKRAKKAMREIGAIEEAGGRIRDGVSLEVSTIQVRAEDVPGHLNPNNQDTQIIYSVKKYLDAHPDERVAVVTADFGMKQQCKANSVECITLGDEWRRPEKDDTARKLRQTQQEPAGLKQRLPAFRINLVEHEGDDIEQVFTILLSGSAGRVDVDAKVGKSREQNPPMVAGEYDRGLGFKNPIGRVGAAAVNRYNKELEGFFEECRRYWERVNERHEEVARSAHFHLAIENYGGSPADAPIAELLFPPRLSLLAEMDDAAARSLFLPEMPEPPQRPLPALMEIARTLRSSPGIAPHLRMPQMPDLNLWTPWAKVVGNADDGFGINAHVKELRHHDREQWGPFLAVFKSWDEAGPFEVEYAMTAKNHPDKLRGKFHVGVQKADRGGEQERAR